MPIKRLLWNPGTDRDIHLLRGNSSRGLLPSLVVVDENGSQPSALNYLLVTPGDSIFFRPLFRNQGPPGVDWENLDIGISVNTETGIVTATPFPVRFLNNFVIEVLGKHQADVTAITTMRVHVHDSVTRVWLTPEQLTVRPSGVPLPEKTTIRFAVRAQFDTGVVGDLTLNHGVQWSSPTPSVDPATGYLQLDAADTPGDDRAITATLPAALGGMATPPATLRVGVPWESISAPPKASIVVGGAWPGTVLPDRVPNILFFGDGFREEDRGAFNRIVDKIVHHLKTDKLMRPWDLLSTSMNFWRVFQPSISLGISLRGEVFTSPEGTRTWAQAMPLIAKPPDSGAWGFGNLLYAAGLPMPADVGRANTAIKADWDAVFDTTPWPAGVKDLIDGWKSMGNRGFVEERDAFPGMSYGTPPAASSTDNAMLNHHEDRGGAAARKAFYKSLKADNGVSTEADKPVGDLWVTSFPAPYDFDNTDLVVLMTAIPAGRAVNGDGYIAMTRADEASKFAVQPVAGRTEWTLDLHESPE